MNKSILNYVLVTAARNEEAHIEKTIASVYSQTVKPAQWIIVSDGSTDGTDRIVKDYAERIPWLTFVRQGKSHDRDFTGKAFAIMLALEQIRIDQYDLIGNIDGDISFDNDLFSFMMDRFNEREALGVAGAVMVQDGYDSSTDARFETKDVFGACQIFRRKCFDDIGGYKPIKWGGIDWLAVKTARMKGWETRTFTEKKFVHYKPMGHENRGVVYARFNYGRKDYLFGNLLSWELLRSLYQSTKPPFVVGGLLLFLGYCWAGLRRFERPMDKEVLHFHRKEQKEKLRQLFREIYSSLTSRKS